MRRGKRMTDSDCIRRRDVLDLFERWEDDLTRQMEENINFPHTRSDLKVCRTQMEVCINAIKAFPPADEEKLVEELAQLKNLLPVVPGDKVYETDGVRVYQRTVRRILFDCGSIAFDEDAIANGNVFLTEREAEQAAGVFREAEDAGGAPHPSPAATPSPEGEGLGRERR